LFVELEDYSDPIRAQVTTIDTFPLSNIGGGIVYDSKATLSFNEVELKDLIFPNPFQ
jgi:hypothetical protein